MNPTENPWTTLSSKVQYDNPWITIRHEEVITPGGKSGIYGVAHFKNKAIGIIPIDHEGNTWLVGQYRYPLQEYSWEIPMGGGPLGIDILVSAQRELKEETGLTAQKWENIARIHTSNSVTDEEGFIFIAEELAEGPSHQDDNEELRVWKLPLAEAIQLVMDNRITDSLSVYGLLKVARLRGL
ncbi:MAG: NUDIX hydrolase [Spirosomataceae bacterium]